jgi:hypothetical protein
VAGLVALVVVGLSPFMSGAEKRIVGGHADEAGVSSERPEGRRGQHAAGEHAAGEHQGQHIRGRNTLREAAEYLGMEVPELLERLGLPPDTEPDQRVGRLLRDHGMSMDDLRALGRGPEQQ